MHCDQSRNLMFEYLEDTLADPVRAQMTDHLETCADCRSDYQVMHNLQIQASAWQELPAPRWQPPRISRRFEISGFQQWFPSLASAAALILVAFMFVTQGQSADPPVPRADVSALPPSMASGTPADYREEREQELQALVRLLQAEMDSRNRETEESLRYVISHQIQGQRDIDELYSRIQQMNYQPEKM